MVSFQVAQRTWIELPGMLLSTGGMCKQWFSLGVHSVYSWEGTSFMFSYAAILNLPLRGSCFYFFSLKLIGEHRQIGLLICPLLE